MTASDARPPSPFEGIPSGVDIARYFWHETEHVNPDCQGIDLYRDGLDYCYLWVDTTVDLDMWMAFMLDVRTHVAVPPGEIGETRDYLFVFVGARDRFDVEWHNQPIDFGAPTEKHWERFESGMKRLAGFIEKSIEDAEEAHV